MVTAERKFLFPDDFSNMADTFDLFRRLSVGAKFNKKKFHNDVENVKVSLSRTILVGEFLSLNHKTFIDRTQSHVFPGGLFFDI